MPSDLALKTMNAVHRLAMRASGNRLGWTVTDMPVVELTTVGRRSGQRRTVLLTSPVRHGDAYVVVASRGGDDQHPAWFLNLRDNPEVEVRVQGGPVQKMHARAATPQERAELWPQVAKRGPYAGYQAKTSREIPLVLLESART